MAGLLKRDESGTQGARRIVRQRIEAALQALDGGGTTDRSVHLARKELKKARAGLRLLRDSLGDWKYKKENAALRDVARSLSAVRDGRVLVDALTSLLEYFGARGAGLPLTKFRRALVRRRARLRAEVLHDPAQLRRVRKALRAARARAGRWRVGRRGWSVLGAGLRRTYSRGRRALAGVQIQFTDESLHEWRKQAKYCWYQLQLLKPMGRGHLVELEVDARNLSDCLGDDHDLAVLYAQAVAARALFPTAASHRALLSLIVRCRTGLQQRAILLGRRLYDETPAAFSARLGEHWRNWRDAAD